VSVLLAFDTAAQHCAAALLSGDDLVTRVVPMATGQAEHLMPLLEDMLAAAGLNWRDLDGIGVGTGPGNFTGIRIAVAAARGLALGLGIPAIGVTGFEAVARDLPRPCTIELPAPRGQVWRQRLTVAGADPPALVMHDTPPPSPDPDMTIAAVARIAASLLGSPQPRPAPCYVRGADAAPPRDPPPLLLP